MKLSELIETLQEIKNEHGDLPVNVFQPRSAKVVPCNTALVMYAEKQLVTPHCVLLIRDIEKG